MCLCLNTVTLDRAIEFVTGIRPSRMFYFWGKKCGSSAKVTISLFWWPKSWSHRCQHMWIIILSAPLTFMHSNNFSFSSPSPLSLLSPLSLVHPLTLPSHQHRLLLVSRAGRHCPKAESAAQGWVWASASSSPTHPSSSICRHLKIFLIVFLWEGGRGISQNVSIAKGQQKDKTLISAKYLMVSRYCTHLYQALKCRTVCMFPFWQK